MSILLDTNVCIAVINGHPPVVRQRLEEAVARRQSIAVSTIVVFELRFGIAKSKRITSNTDRTNAFLDTVKILPFESEDALIASELRFDLERVGTPIGPYDYLIAAQALRHSMRLVTANAREFSRVKGLRWENWAE